MKCILFAIKPRWCTLIMKRKKTVEVRTSKALASAIQKLIDKYGYADIYGYCSKTNYLGFISNKYIGKVNFKFRCYKVEKIIFGTTLYNDLGFFTDNLYDFDLCKQSCLTKEEMRNYLKVKTNGLSGYAIHISDLEIFKPKELSEFRAYKPNACEKCWCVFNSDCILNKNCPKYKRLKAPQNFCYVEVE